MVEAAGARGEGARGRARFESFASGALLIAAVQFVILTAVAMLVFRGGNEQAPAAAHYSFTHNFFSDLGATELPGGAAAPLAVVLFAYSLVCVGLSEIVFGWAVAPLAKARDGAGGRVAGVLAALGATVGGLGFIGVAATPHNLYSGLHKQIVNIAFGFLLIFVVSLCVLEVRARWSRRLTVPNIVYVVLLAVYVYILFWGPGTDTEGGLVFQVVAQKIIVYASIINLGWQAYGFRHGGWRGATESPTRPLPT